jgi:hypothetical protein
VEADILLLVEDQESASALFQTLIPIPTCILESLNQCLSCSSSHTLLVSSRQL